MNWNKILSYLGNIKIKHLVYVALVVAIIGWLQSCSKNSELEEKNEQYKTNVEALNDSLRKEKDRLGDVIYKKKQFHTKVDSLKNWNKELHNKVQKLKDKASQATDIKYRVKMDTFRVENEVKRYPDSSKYGLTWKYDTTYSEYNHREIRGVSNFKLDSIGNISPLNTHVKKDIIKMELFTGVTKNSNGTKEIFVKSKYPGFEVTKLHGAELETKKDASSNIGSRFIVGPGIGVGLDKNFEPTPTVSINVVYNLNRQVKKIFNK